MNFMFGLWHPPVWVYFVVTIVMMQISIAAVTLYLHRDQTHRGLDLHPAVRHFCRFWLWLTTAIVTREWVAVHRKHHARCETEDDPHSPQVKGLKKVLLEGAELYRSEADDVDTLEKYGRGTPDDWLERNLYTKHCFAGIGLLFALDVLVFGVVGITIWAVQMAAMPVFSAGVINGIGHYYGYRNYECDDAATNIVPWGVWLGGEELHNNHHAFPSSAKFSSRKWEFDIGWLYISLLRVFGLARVRRVAPTPVVAEKAQIDLETVRAIIVNRMHVLRDYTRTVTLPVLYAEAKMAGSERAARMWRRARRALTRRPELLDEEQRARLQRALDDSATMRTVHEYRERLHRLWSGATVSNDRLLGQVREWCSQAEATGIRALEEFSHRLRGYTLQT